MMSIYYVDRKQNIKGNLEGSREFIEFINVSAPTYPTHDEIHYV